MAALNKKNCKKKKPKSDTNVKHDFSQIKNEDNVSYMYMCHDNRAKKHTVNKMYKWRNLTKLELAQDFAHCGQCMQQRKINCKINVNRHVHDVLFAISFNTKPAYSNVDNLLFTRQ